MNEPIYDNTAAGRPAGDKRRVLIVDDHPIVRHGLKQMIDAEPDQLGVQLVNRYHAVKRAGMI